MGSATPSKGVPFILRFYHRRFAYIIAIPIVLYEGIFLFYPMAEGVRDSLTNIETGSTTLQWVGLANYRRMVSDPVFWQTIQNTVLYAIAVILLALTVALGTALLMNRAFRGRAFFRAVLTTPWAFPDVPTAIAFVWMMSPPNDVLGEIARWIPGVHATPLWLQDPLWALVVGSPLQYPHGPNRTVRCRINLLNLGTAQILTIPGEALPNIGFYLKRKMRGRHNLLFGLTNDAFGYILTKVDFNSFPRYDYVSRTSLGEMTGEILIEKSLELVKKSPPPDKGD